MEPSREEQARRLKRLQGSWGAAYRTHLTLGNPQAALCVLLPATAPRPTGIGVKKDVDKLPRAQRRQQEHWKM